MKVTRGNLRVIIREMLLREQEEDRLPLRGRRGSMPVELTDSPSEDAVNASWPDGVYHNGKKVFETFYGDNSRRAYEWLASEDYDGQEVYLGYDPQSDNFVMGFDAFYEGRDSYDDFGDDSMGGSMEGVLILLDPRGRALETIATVQGGMYPEGRRAAKTAMPQLIDVRLD